MLLLAIVFADGALLLLLPLLLLVPDQTAPARWYYRLHFTSAATAFWHDIFLFAYVFAENLRSFGVSDTAGVAAAGAGPEELAPRSDFDKRRMLRWVPWK